MKGSAVSKSRRVLVLALSVWFAVVAAAPFWLSVPASTSASTLVAESLFTTDCTYNSGTVFSSSGVWSGTFNGRASCRVTTQYAPALGATIPASAGTDYLFSVVGRGYSASANLSVQFLTPGGSGVASLISTHAVGTFASSSWVTDSVTLTAPAGTGQIRFQFPSYSTTAFVFDSFAVYAEDAPPPPDPTPTPEPTPTPTPAPSVDDYWEADCVDERIYGPPPPGYEHPPLCDSSARQAAAVDTEYPSDPNSRCSNTNPVTDNRAVASGDVVISCSELVSGWDSMLDSYHASDTYGAASWYLGRVENSGTLQLVGYTRPSDYDYQTWCVPSSTYTWNDPPCGALAHYWGVQPSGLGKNYPPSRKVARGAVLASIITGTGQTDVYCTAANAGGLASYGTAAFFRADVWTCPLPDGLTGDVFVRGLVEQMDTRIHSPEPNDELDVQHYSMSLVYGVLSERGHWVEDYGIPLQTEWAECKDASIGQGCTPTVPGTWADDVYDTPAAPGSTDDGGPPTTDQNTYGPISGEAGKPFVGYATCTPGQDFLAVGEWVAWAGCHIYNGTMTLLNGIIDLLIPGEGLAQAFDEFIAETGELVPFGWYGEIAEQTELAMASGATTLPPWEVEFIMGHAFDFAAPLQVMADGAAPYRGLLAASVVLSISLGTLYFIVGSLGGGKAKVGDE